MADLLWLADLLSVADLPWAAACHLALPLVAHSADLEDQVAALELVVSQVQEVSEITGPYQAVEHQDFCQVALEAALELDHPASVPSAGLKVPASVASPSLEVQTSAPFMEVETLVPALSLAHMDSTASSMDPERQAAFSEAAVALPPAPAREADLDPLALAWEEALEAAVLPSEVDKDLSSKAPEAFTVHTIPLSGASHKAQAPLVLAAATVDMDFPVTATATTATD